MNDIKISITLHVQTNTTNKLRSTVEHTIHRLEILYVNESDQLANLPLHRPGHNCASYAISS